MHRALLVVAMSCAALSGLISGCFSPVQDDEIDALGPEVDGVEEDELHRYGQNCLACHGGYGDAPRFTLGGTVFATPNDDVPVAGAKIIVNDSAGQSIELTSNCAGNFYVEAEDFEAQFPLRVEIECPLPDGTSRRSVMGTRINRDGGCASCHANGPATADAPAQVYCVKEQPDPPFEVDQSCEGGPAAGGASE